MSPVTIESIKSTQDALKAMIEQLERQIGPAREIEIDECTISLKAGERYAGVVLGEDGDVLHHLVLMAARPDKKLAWQAAMDWAESVGGVLPTRQEQALLYANCKPHLKPEWHWSCETHKDDASYAWGCDFTDGHQYPGLKSAGGCAVAVRCIHLNA